MTDTKQAKDLAQAIVQGTEASPMISRTPAGPSDAGRREAQADAINQVFALFRLNYHNQFYAAYADGAQLNEIKRLWLETLGEFAPDILLAAAKAVLETSEYLPTIKLMRECCERVIEKEGLPSPRSAFLEACNQPSPKAAQRWSHPAVFLAGRDSDWFFLANNPESVTWPVFRGHYQRWREKALQGDIVALPDYPTRNRADSEDILEREAQLRALAKLREETGL